MSMSWRKYLPNIYVGLEIPLISVKTVMFRECQDQYAIDWFRIEWRVWRWNGSFRLYYNLGGY